MAAVFQELTLRWGEETVRVKPTMALLNDIEQKVSLSRVAYRLSSGDPPLSQLAVIVSHFLQAGGIRVTDEQVYAEIMHGGHDQVTAMAEAVMMAAFPQVGKPAAPATKGKKASKGRRKKSAGATTSASGAESGD